MISRIKEYTYDQEADAIYITFSDKPVASTRPPALPCKSYFISFKRAKSLMVNPISSSRLASKVAVKVLWG